MILSQHCSEFLTSRFYTDWCLLVGTWLQLAEDEVGWGVVVFFEIIQDTTYKILLLLIYCINKININTSIIINIRRKLSNILLLRATVKFSRLREIDR